MGIVHPERLPEPSLAEDLAGEVARRLSKDSGLHLNRYPGARRSLNDADATRRKVPVPPRSFRRFLPECSSRHSDFDGFRG